MEEIVKYWDVDKQHIYEKYTMELGVKHGKYERYYPFGIHHEEESNYKRGKKHGKCYRWIWYENCEAPSDWEEYNYKNDLLDGICKNWKTNDKDLLYGGIL